MKEINLNESFCNENDFKDHVRKVAMEAVETQEAFIFKTIEPFINEVAGFEISKKELVDAVQLIRLQRAAVEKYGTSLSYKLTTATNMSRELGEAYDRGFMDGVKKERKRLMTMLEEDLEE